MKDTKRLTSILLPLLMLVAIASLLTAVHLLGQEWGAALLHLATVTIGSVLTYALLALMSDRIEKRQADKLALEAQKAHLIKRLGSDVTDLAVPAVDDLRRRGWLTNALLRRAELSGANLEGALLMEARLEEANLQDAILQGANLADARLGGANLARANLRHAVLPETNLSHACLYRADLTKANLSSTYLKGASMRHAILEGAHLGSANLSNANLEDAQITAEQLEQAISLSGTILPDGTELSEDNWQARFEEWREIDSMKIHPFDNLDSLDQVNPALRDLVHSLMTTHERIVLGFWHRRDQNMMVSVLTDRRVIAGHITGGFGTLLDRISSDFPLEHSITDLPLQWTSSISQFCEPQIFPQTPESIALTNYDNSKKVLFYFPSRDEFYHRMLTLLRESVDRARTRQQPPSAADRLRELTALRNDRLITEHEFQSKRQLLIDDF